MAGNSGQSYKVSSRSMSNLWMGGRCGTVIRAEISQTPRLSERDQCMSLCFAVQFLEIVFKNNGFRKCYNTESDKRKITSLGASQRAGPRQHMLGT